MSEHEKALVRAALVWHAVNILIGPGNRRKADRALSLACQRLLKKHPRRTYRRASRGHE